MNLYQHETDIMMPYTTVYATYECLNILMPGIMKHYTLYSIC